MDLATSLASYSDYAHCGFPSTPAQATSKVQSY